MKMAPPVPPCVHVDEDDNLRRLRYKLFLVTASLVTLVATVWICTFGWIPAIVAIMVAKHILVAILVMGLGVDSRSQT